MTCQQRVYQWYDIVQAQLPHLSKPQAYGLAWWSLGVVLTRSCSLTAVTLLWSTARGRSDNTARQQLREWYYEARHKRGAKRRSLAVEACFAPLLAWVLRYWQGTQLALALDATTLHDRFVVLCISVLYRGCAIPVAWAVLPANTPGAWNGHWLRLLRRLRPAVPPHYCVLVLADRGLYSRRIFRRIVRLGWHPLLRIKGGGTFRAQRQRHYEALGTIAARLGGCGAVRGTAFQGTNRLECTLAVYWEKGCGEPWLGLTDLPPEQVQGCWYGLRAWIEHGFKFTKREGWQWQRNRMLDPQRAARLWLVLAVATLWVVTLGSEAEVAQLAGPPAVTAATPARPRQVRQVSVFRRGWVTMLAALLQGRAWCEATEHVLQPEPWPCVPACAALYYDTS
jgi:hypothetical protein